MKIKHLFMILAASVAAFALSSCEKPQSDTQDDPTPGDSINYTVIANFYSQSSTWDINLYSEEYIRSGLETGRVVSFIIQMDETATFEDGLPTGKFVKNAEALPYLELAAIMDHVEDQMPGMVFFEEGELTITAKGDNFVLAASGKDENGDEYTVNYEGSVALSEGEIRPEVGDDLDQPVDIRFYQSFADYFPETFNNGCATYRIVLEDRYAKYPVYVDIWIAVDPKAPFDNKLPLGTFEINKSDPVVFNTVYKAYYLNLKAECAGEYYSGAVTISEADGYYTVVLECPVTDGTARFYYKGKIEFREC